MASEFSIYYVLARSWLVLMTASVEEAADGRGAGFDDLVPHEDSLQILPPQSPSLNQRVVHLSSGGERLVGFIADKGWLVGEGR